MKNEITVLEKKNQAVTTSRNVSEIFNKRHDNVLKSIQNLECSNEFSLLNYKESKYKDSRGKTQIEYIITKDGFTLLVMGFTGKKAMKFKEGYIQRFNEMEKVLNEKQTIEWKETRKIGKQENRNMNDKIKEFIEYAETQGSKNFKRYYSNFAKLSNKSVGIVDGMRDTADCKRLFFHITTMGIIEEKLQEGILNGKHYKEIYKDCKKQIEEFNKFIPAAIKLN